MGNESNPTLWPFTIRRGYEHAATFYSTPGDFSAQEKSEVALHLGLGSESGLHFEVCPAIPAKSRLLVGQLGLKRFKTQSDREFWFEN